MDIILNLLTDDGFEMNFVRRIVDNLANPLPLLEIESRERRVRNASYFELIIENYTDIQFYEYFRMSKATAEELVNIVGHHLTNPNEIAILQKKVLFSVWVLSNRESFFTSSCRFGLPESTGHAIFRSIITTISNLLPLYVIWPDVNNYATIANTFLCHTRGLPGIIGVIDGCHIQFKQPIENKVKCYNQNESDSVVLQGTCDHTGKFIDIYVGSPGERLVSKVFRSSSLFKRIKDDSLIPPNYHLLGNTTYPLMENIMTPFFDTGHLTASQVAYNTRLNNVQSTTKRTFGLLKGKFTRLKSLNIRDFELSYHVITAACVLHNFILDHQLVDTEDNVNMEDEDDIIPQHNEEESDLELEAVEKRNRIVSLFQ